MPVPNLAGQNPFGLSGCLTRSLTIKICDLRTICKDVDLTYFVRYNLRQQKGFNSKPLITKHSTPNPRIRPIRPQPQTVGIAQPFASAHLHKNGNGAEKKPTINPISAATAAGIADRGASVVTIAAMNGDAWSLGNVEPRISEESSDKSKVWKLTEISEPSQCRSLRLPENSRVTKISRLIFTNSGNAILALASNAIHLLWKWQRSDLNSNGKATATVPPQLWRPSSGILMKNDVAGTNHEDAVPCFALSKNDSYTMVTFMPPPPAATFLAFHPHDNNIMAIGMDNSTIVIYNVRVNEVIAKLRGHSKRITGLAFSHVLNVLVSSGADSQLCVWNTDGWEMQEARFLQVSAWRTPTAQSDMAVQFHQDQMHFLVVDETQLAIYETTKLECLKQWVPRESSAPITHATFSCDSQLVYASLLDATVCVFSAVNLRLCCRINPSAYLPASVSSNVHPLVIAAHPSEPNGFALGLSDGGVLVFEPLESENKWGVPPPVENGSASSVAATPSVGAPGPEQAQRR
ncbi:WD40 repeat - like 10 [Theobroma cacao]|nr:WD40 repeat - like 10 [Theobroma cacao]